MIYDFKNLCNLAENFFTHFRMILFPNAKINIGLNIVKKRKDGFHDIETVFYPIGLSDILEVIENTSSSKNIFRSSGIKIPGNANENLCLKAHQLIKQDYDIPAVKIHLHKTIPIGAGLGGGSSDAAFCIKIIDGLFHLNLSWGEKHHYARQIGSDCSFFVTNKPAFAEGKGDHLESANLNLTGYYFILVNPDIHISTASAYAGASAKKPKNSLEELIATLPVSKWKNNIENDFENSIFVKYPSIKKIKQQLYDLGATYASMSGSGSSVYGIFYSPPEEKKLRKHFKDWFIWQDWLK